MKEYLNEILLIGVGLTFIGTTANIYYTRRNLKTTKYIDTITSERIKWLDIIRNEVTNIITNIHFTLKVYTENIQDSENEMRKYEVYPDYECETQSNSFDVQTSAAIGKKKEIWSQSDFIQNLYLFKIRLNPIQDQKIIEIVDYFIRFYTDSQYKSANEIPCARKKVDLLVTQIQELLKHEWEKVKMESKGK